MTIAGLRETGKQYLDRIPKDVLILAILVLTATASFGLGVLAGRDGLGGASGLPLGAGKHDLWIEQLPADDLGKGGGPAAAASANTSVGQGSDPYVASRTGKKYYLATCGSAKRIAEANRVYFATKADAEAAGLTPAANCPGL